MVDETLHETVLNGWREVAAEMERGEGLMYLRDNQEKLRVAVIDTQKLLGKLIQMLDAMFRGDPLVRFQAGAIRRFHQELLCSEGCKHLSDTDPRASRF